MNVYVANYKMQAISAQFARPADTAVYAAGDVVADSTSAPSKMVFSEAVRDEGGSGAIVGARLITNDTSALAKEFSLHLYTNSDSPQNDNAAFASPWAERLTRIGKIDFTALAATGGNYVESPGRSLSPAQSFQAGTGTRNIYGILANVTGHTPGSAKIYIVELVIERR